MNSDQPAQKTVLCTVGTRPEAIKMAPVIQALKRQPWANCRVLVTAQHRELVDQMLEFFDLNADIDLNLMRENQTLVDLTARMLVAVDETIGKEKPDIVLGQGDTTTVLSTALASFYRKVPFAHVEAGLRTHNLMSPFPEEANRVLAGHLSAIHFAPTPMSQENLIREGIHPNRVIVTGNTVIDALMLTAAKEVPIGVPTNPNYRMILVTAHRRDSFGEPIKHICQAVRALVERFEDVEVVWPVHPNPSVKGIVEEMLGIVPRIRLCEPLAYGSFVTAMRQSYLILTDSGGVQEEAPALGKPVLVMRDESERPEAVHYGVAKLVGPNRERIIKEATTLLEDRTAYAAMSQGASPYGDGYASERIAYIIGRYLNAIPEPQVEPVDESATQELNLSDEGRQAA